MRRAVRALSGPAAYEAVTTNVGRYESTRMLNTAMCYLMNERLVGDYVEFGVYQGATFVEAFHAAELCRLDQMRFIACDSFQGLPSAGGPFEKGEFRASRETFEATLRANKVPPARVQIVEGFYSDELLAALPSEIALAWIDCDLYESTVPALDSLADRLIDGAVVCFDDWFTHRGDPDQGEQLATREWLERNPQHRLHSYRPFSWAGQSFLFARR